jgi:hypothetical protein
VTQHITLDGDEIDELRHLLGSVEDWLLHTDALVLADLAAFLGGEGDQRAHQLIDALGDAGVLLRRRARHLRGGDR